MVGYHEEGVGKCVFFETHENFTVNPSMYKPTSRMTFPFSWANGCTISWLKG